MKKLIILFICLFSILLTSHTEIVFVKKVIDGDTFITSDGTRVRIKDIDTPETKHPTKGQEPGGNEATRLAKMHLEGQYVFLEGNSTGKYGRRISRVKLMGGQDYSEIVRMHGYDKNTTYRNSGLINDIGSNKKTLVNGYLYSSSNKPAKTKKTINTFSPSYSSGTTYVKGYYRKDGTYVQGYWKNNTKTSTIKLPQNLFSPSSSFSSGSVYVNGYYRKDGTYVKPHYRKK